MKRQLSTLALLSVCYISSGYADITIDTLTAAPLDTTTVENITITNTGRVTTAAADAITMDTSNQTVTIAPGNTTGGCGAFTGCALVTTGSGNAITITEPQNAVLIGASTTISAIDSGITISAGSDSIYNEGKIYGGTAGGAGNAISVTATGGASTVITNVLGSHIEAIGTGSGISVASDGLTLSNAGTIKTTLAGANGVVFFNDFAGITNTGTITAALSTALLLDGATYTGTITNTGTIVSGSGFGMFATSAVTGTTNNSGTIRGTGAPIAAVSFVDGFGIFNNTGLIESTGGAGSALSLSPAASMQGTFNNSGTIQNDDPASDTVILGGKFDGFNNSGTIQSTSIGAGSGVFASGATIVNGFVNTGDILYPGATAIKFDGGVTAIKLFQNAGTIEGAVILASAGGDVLEMNSGTIDGDVSTTSGSPSTLTLNSGEITGTLNVGVNASDIVNLTGTTLAAIDGNTGAAGNTYNISGGSFTSLSGGSALLDTMNVTSNFTFDGPGTITDLNRIEITKGANAVFNGDITTLKTEFLVTNGSGTINGILSDSGAATVRTVAGTGVFQVGTDGAVTINDGDNFGQFTLLQKPQAAAGIANNFNISFTNDYTQNPGSNLAVQIGGPLNYGTITAAGTAVLDPTSTVSAFLTPIAFIPDQSVYPIINTFVPMGTVPTVLAPSSITLSFTGLLTPGGSEFDLIANRSSYTVGALTPNAIAVGNILDALAVGAGPANSDLLFLLVQLDQIQTATEMTAALEQLIPPMDYGMIEGAHVIMDNSFNTIQRRLEDLRGVREVWSAGYEMVREWDGINYGDCVGDDEVLVGTWIKGFGDIFEQKKHLGFDGYKGNAVGFALGFDWSALDDDILGICASYSKVHVDTKNPQSNVQNIESYMGTFYAFFEPMDALYVDVLLGVASSRFTNRRNISIGALGNSAFSKFFGLQSGTQVEAGYVFLKYDFFVAPVGRMKYTHLRLNNYTETGAGGLSLTVDNRAFNEFLLGGGLRFAYKRDFVQASYVPNAQVYYLYAVENQAQTTAANFLGGGTAFHTNGIKPGKDIVLIDVGINAHTNDGYVFRGKFEWEWRNHFMAYSGFLELYHRWL